MNQTQLPFDSHKLARRDDPDTSKQAARAAQGLRGAVCSTCRTAKRQRTGSDRAANGQNAGSERAAIDLTGPDLTGPDRTGQDLTCVDGTPEGRISAGPSGPAGQGPERVSAVLLNETSWRGNSRGRTMLVFRLAKRLETEGATVDDVRALWAWSRRNATDPGNPGGYFDALVQSEDTWRRALASAGKAAL